MVGWAVAIGAHGGLWVFAVQSEPSLESWSAALALQVHEEVSRSDVIEIEDAPIEAAREQTPAPAPKAGPLHKRSRESRTFEKATPAPAAQAGDILAQDVDEREPVDLTSNAFVTGTSAYAGGATAPGGTNASAVGRQGLHQGAPPVKASGAGNASQPVRLAASEWSCPWPEEAIDQDIYERDVVLRVVVRNDGTVESARVLSDPGIGFGRAALDCARTTRFSAATDAAGRPIRATSPPIRVRFTR
jgi:protein TonB